MPAQIKFKIAKSFFSFMHIGNAKRIVLHIFINQYYARKKWHYFYTLTSFQHFKSLADDNKLDNRLKNGGVIDDQDGAQGGDDVDRLVF